MFDLRLILNTFAILCCLFALWKGGRAERMGALAVLANVVIGQTGHLVAPALNDQIRLVNDGLTALLLLGVTVRYGALWMGGVMLFYAAQFAMHSFYIVTERKPDFLRALINNVDYLGIVSCLIIGTIVAWRRRVVNRRKSASLSSTAP
ncbi:hypothetical protein [Phenylobacterium sp.]|uniref:hypothetical protein n=1 Tax=Phenylobacterium sp. TaxID=1871053 RepID=UPI003D2A9C93